MRDKQNNRIISADVTFCLLKSSLHAQTTDARNASRRCKIIGEVKGTLVKVEREKKDPNTCMDISNGIQIDRIKSNGLLSSLNSSIHDDLSNNLMMDETTSILSQNNNNVIEMSQIRLYRIKRKLESLDKVLRAYSVLDSCVTRNIEGSKENGNDEIQTIYQNVVEILDTLKLEIKNINETKRNKILLNVKEYNDKMLQTNSSDYELYESIDSEKSSSISMKSYSEPLIDDPLDLAIIERNQRNEERSIKTDALSRSNHVIDQESVLNDFQLQKKKELSDFSVSLEIDEDPSIISTNSSQVEISKDSDLENKSTEMLIREALKCKKELLSRVKLHKFYSNVEIRKEREEITNNFKDIDTGWLDTDKSFQSKLLDIITEESTSSCTDKTSRTYMFLQMKQSSEMSDDGSSSSPNIEINDKNQEKNVYNELNTSEVYNLSKEALPIVSSQYFSFNDLSIIPKYQNIILQELPSDFKSSLLEKNKSIKSANSLLKGKRVYGEVATWDDDDIDDDRKRHCHRDEEEKNRLISYGRLRRAKSVPKSFNKKGINNVQRNTFNEVILKTMRNMNSTELFRDRRNNGNTTIFHENENEGIISFGTDDLLSWNRTTDSSSAGSTKYQFTIDNGSMTNFFSSTDSNLEIYNKYSSIKEKDDALYNQDLSLRRRPGILSFGQLKKMNNLFSNENDIFKNPYFLGEKALSEATCGETIELNLIPISVSIDSHESNIFAVTHSKIFDDLNNVSSTLQISYNNDLETSNVTEIIEKEPDKKEMLQIMPDNRKGILCISDRTTNFVNIKNDERKNIQRKGILNETKQSNITRSRSNVIAQKSSSYITGDTSSSMSKIDFQSCGVSESNISANSSFKEIDIKNDILELCIDSCIDLLRKKNLDNNESLQLMDVASCECNSNDNKTSNETSVSYIEANDFQSFNEIVPHEESNVKQLKNKSEGFIFDGSIKYKKPSPVEEQNVRRNLRAINSNWSKSKRTNVDTKSKDSINVDNTTYTRRKTTNSNSQFKMKSNLSIIVDKDNAPNSTRLYTRPNSCNLSQERSQSYAGSYKNDLSSRSAVFPQCDDRKSTKEEEPKKGKGKFVKTEMHSNYALSSTPKSFSKSCIPILKSRLDARRTEHICRSKSPTRGPLTMTGLCRDRIDNNDENVSEVHVIPTEGSSINKEDSQKHLDNSKTTMFEERYKTESSKENTNVIDENCSKNVSRERTIIYVNIINHHDHNVTRILDPVKFLEYTSKGAPIAQNVNEPDAKLRDNVSSSSVIMAQEKNTLPKLITIVSSSSVMNETDNDENDSSNSSSNRHVSIGTLKNFWSVTIQQKEMEISVKPSVTDTSTSMSDFLNISEIIPLHEHQIFGMPKELTNEEYSYLFEILSRKQNLGHLKEIQNLCNRLRLRNKNFE
ncbi:uncharacterized protein LOC124426765 [Vespa crabro]|uniref:uncharacterized protein LOC124426765 n=1 Tax=Vespa crabro TaxID=7445 RepID=UPI001EFFD9F2|nr:uncharacterized protein LOC124426765 [Vespa crabro]